jgi:hypothetical protein
MGTFAVKLKVNDVELKVPELEDDHASALFVASLS